MLAATAQAGVDQADFALTMDGPDSALIGSPAVLAHATAVRRWAAAWHSPGASPPPCSR